ncbi:MAG TPA: hypothetical protein VGB77_20620 [Abditibacteriaceae bacterium]|jgi:TolB protein
MKKLWVVALLTVAMINGCGGGSSGYVGTSGSKIVFISSRNGNQEIYAMDSDGSNQRRLTRTDEGESSSAISLDGRRIAFTRPNIAERNYDVYIMDFDGSNQRKLTSAGWESGFSSPSLNRDGNLVAFDYSARRTAQIYVQSTSSNRMTSSIDYGSDPALSADGQKLAYSQLCYPCEVEVFKVTRLDGSIEFSTETPGVSYQTPSFHPNGSNLVITKRMYENGTSNADIFLLNPLNGQLTPLSTGPFQESNPTFSPDGKQIAYSSNESGSNQIWVMDADGTNKRRLTGEGDNAGPSWGG